MPFSVGVSLVSFCCKSPCKLLSDLLPSCLPRRMRLSRTERGFLFRDTFSFNTPHFSNSSEAFLESPTHTPRQRSEQSHIPWVTSTSYIYKYLWVPIAVATVWDGEAVMLMEGIAASIKLKSRSKFFKTNTQKNKNNHAANSCSISLHFRWRLNK